MVTCAILACKNCRQIKSNACNCNHSFTAEIVCMSFLQTNTLLFLVRHTHLGILTYTTFADVGVGFASDVGVATLWRFLLDSWDVTFR